MRPLLLLLPLALLAGCAADDATPSPTPTPDASGSVATASVSLIDRTPGVGVPPTTMGIEPATLALTLGERVNLTVTNDGNMVHNLVIDALGVTSDDLAAGDAQSIEFTPTEAGEYEMYCSIGGDGPLGHRAQGMRGTVTVA